MKKLLSLLFGLCGIFYGITARSEDICCQAKDVCGAVCCPTKGCNAEGTGCAKCESGQVEGNNGFCCPPEQLDAQGDCCERGYMRIGGYDGYCCPADKVTKRSSCCFSSMSSGEYGVLDREGECCGYVLDKNNECCSTGVLDSDGYCCGYVDQDNKCCDAPGYVLDNAQVCCDNSDIVNGYCCGDGYEVTELTNAWEQGMCCPDEFVANIDYNGNPSDSRTTCCNGSSYAITSDNYCCFYDKVMYLYSADSTQCCKDGYVAWFENGDYVYDPICCPAEKYDDYRDNCCIGEGYAFDEYRVCCENSRRDKDQHCCPEYDSWWPTGLELDDYKECCYYWELSLDDYNNEKCCRESDGYRVDGSSKCCVEAKYAWNENRCCEEGYTVENGFCCATDNDGQCCDTTQGYSLDDNRNCCSDEDKDGDGFCCMGGRVVNGYCCLNTYETYYDDYGNEQCCIGHVDHWNNKCCDPDQVYRNNPWEEGYCCLPPMEKDGSGKCCDQAEIYSTGACCADGEELISDVWGWNYCCRPDRAYPYGCCPDDMEIQSDGGDCCPSSVLDGDGICCWPEYYKQYYGESGFGLDVNQNCCFDYLDSNRNCCSYDAVDRYGYCCGYTLDGNDECCYSGYIDNNRNCCGSGQESCGGVCCNTGYCCENCDA